MHEIETSRLRLRMFALSDLDALCRVTADPEVMRFIGPGKPLTRAETEANLATIIKAFRRRGFGRWALVHKADDTLIGYCGLSAGNEAVGVEVAYMLATAYWGRGLATEAARACLRYGFAQLGLDHIAALTMPGNHRSRRVVERLGMRFVKDACYYGYDCVQYSLAREDFRHGGSLYLQRRLPLPPADE